MKTQRPTNDGKQKGSNRGLGKAERRSGQVAPKLPKGLVAANFGSKSYAVRKGKLVEVTPQHISE